MISAGINSEGFVYFATLATYILINLFPLIVIGYAIIHIWQKHVSDYKQQIFAHPYKRATRDMFRFSTYRGRTGKVLLIFTAVAVVLCIGLNWCFTAVITEQIPIIEPL